jgi:hypothetical protein
VKRKPQKQRHTTRPILLDHRLTANTTTTVKVYPTVMNRSAAHAMVLGHMEAAQKALNRLQGAAFILPDPIDRTEPDPEDRRAHRAAETAIPQIAAELSDHVMRICQHLGDWLGADAQD